MADTAKGRAYAAGVDVEAASSPSATLRWQGSKAKALAVSHVGAQLDASRERLSAQELRHKVRRRSSVTALEMLFEESLTSLGSSRDEYDRMVADRRRRASSLAKLQVWSTEHEDTFAEHERMTLAAHFVQQALDRNDVCHVRRPPPPQRWQP